MAEPMPDAPDLGRKSLHVLFDFFFGIGVVPRQGREGGKGEQSREGPGK